MTGATERDRIHAIRQALGSQRLSINALDDGTGVILDVEKEQLLTMNRTGLSLMQGIERGADSPEALTEQLTAQFQVSHEQAAADVRGFIQSVWTLMR